MSIPRADKKKRVKPKIPYCCKKPMVYKESYDEYVCDICGKTKKAYRMSWINAITNKWANS